MQRKQKRTSSNGAENEAIVSSLLRWFCASARDLPWRRTRDPYAIWVSEIMLQQTQVKTVIPYWERWMKELPTIQSLAQAPSEKIHKLWEGLGYYTRVRNMQKAAQVIVQESGGNFPDRYEDILELPGIGRYTAGAICSIAFNQPTPIVDGNVIRVLARVCAISGNPKDKETNAVFWQVAADLVQTAGASRGTGISKRHAIPCCSFLNQSLMELGALICTPRDPNCNICPLKTICTARRENRVAELPSITKQAPPTHRTVIAFVVERDGRFLVRQRPAGVVNGHLWEFPNFDRTRRFAPAPFTTKPKSAPLLTVRHSITRYRITMDVFRADITTHDVPGSWFSLDELQHLAFSSAHKKIVQRLQQPI